MRPMFKELFIDTDADDLATEDDRRPAAEPRTQQEPEGVRCLPPH
jgi:hypothetical protein